MPRKKDDDYRIDSVKEILESHIEREDKIFDRIQDKLEIIDDRVSSIHVTLEKQQVILDEHVKRTNLLEEKIKPIETQSSYFKLVFKILLAIVGAGGAGLGVKELLNILWS